MLAGRAQAAPKTELVLAIGGEPDTGYDPLFGWGRYGHSLFQSSLLNRDVNLATKPDLATAWTLSEDRLTWTITRTPSFPMERRSTSPLPSPPRLAARST